MSMCQLDRLLKGLLLYLFFVMPCLVEYVLYTSVYRYIGPYDGSDGIDTIWVTEKYSLSDATPYGNHWIFLLLFLVWAAGFAGFGVCRYIKERRLLENLRRASHLCEEELLKTREEAHLESDVKRKISIWISSVTDAPFVTGILWPAIFLPETEIDGERLSLVLRHERIHCKRWDCLYRRLLFWLCALYWFHPYFRRFAEYFIEVNEMACDELALKGADARGKRVYAGLLVGMGGRQREMGNWAFLTGQTKCCLERRLENMTKKRTGMKGTAFAAAAFLFAASCPMMTYAASAGAVEMQDGFSRWVYTGTEEAMTGNMLTEETDMLGAAEMTEADVPVQTRGTSEIDQDVSGKSKASLGKVSVSAGEDIVFLLRADSSSASFRAGYINSSGRRTYVSVSNGKMNHTFTVSKAGTYELFVENLGNSTIHISGSVTVF